MSRNPFQHPMDEPMVDSTPRVSALAVSSLVFGLLCCIPGSGLIGAILGGAGLVGISRAQGRLSGRGMALTGMILGLLGMLLWIGIGIGTLMSMKELGRFVQPVHAITTGDFSTARQRLSPDSAAKLTDARAKEFSQELEGQLGNFKHMPQGIGQWLSGYAEVGEKIEDAGAAAPNGTTPVPIPVYFEKDIALVMVFIEKDSSGGFPPIRNISVHTKAGKVIWLIPPDSGP